MVSLILTYCFIWFYSIIDATSNGSPLQFFTSKDRTNAIDEFSRERWATKYSDIDLNLKKKCVKGNVTLAEFSGILLLFYLCA